MGRYHDFSIKEHGDGRLEVIDPPPIGGLSAFSLDLLGEERLRIGVDERGWLVVVGLVFRPVAFDAGPMQFGPPQLLICERVS